MISEARIITPRLDANGEIPKRRYSGPHPRDYDPEGWERRIQNWIAHYERLGLRENRQSPPRKPGPDMQEYRRQCHARDAEVLAMRNGGASVAAIAAAMNMTRMQVYHAIDRAKSRQNQEAA